MRESQFSRLEALLGKESVEKVRASSVLVAGVGAVGGWALEAVARFGAGAIRAVDFDTVCESNLNRQMVALWSTIGMKKVLVAEKRVLDINPACRFEAVDAFIDSSNAKSLASNCDIILDCVDSVQAKVALMKAAEELGIPIVSSMGAAIRKDISLFRTTALSKTEGCPLAKAVRTAVRKEGLDLKRVRAVWSPERVDFDYRQAEADRAGQRKRTALGSLPTVTCAVGQMVAQEALFILMGL